MAPNAHSGHACLFQRTAGSHVPGECSHVCVQALAEEQRYGAPTGQFSPQGTFSPQAVGSATGGGRFSPQAGGLSPQAVGGAVATPPFSPYPGGPLGGGWHQGVGACPAGAWQGGTAGGIMLPPEGVSAALTCACWPVPGQLALELGIVCLA